MKTKSKSLPATTTEQEDTMETATKAGQRRINAIWEVTQGSIAIAITSAVIYCAIVGIDSRVINNAFFLIVSMYFVRTNHTIIGGVKQPPYTGR